MSDYDRQAHLANIHAQRKETMDSKANAAIDALLHQRKPITFRSVSQISGIGVATLYRHDRIRERIETLRDGIPKTVPKHSKAKAANEESILVASLQRKIKRLEAENAKLRKINRNRLENEWLNL